MTDYDRTQIAALTHELKELNRHKQSEKLTRATTMKITLIDVVIYLAATASIIYILFK